MPCKVLIAMYPTDEPGHLAPNDIDSIITLCIRSLENTDQVTRHSHAQLVGHMLAWTQIERAVPVPEAPQKNKKDADDANTDLSSPTHAAGEVTKPMFTPAEMLAHLSGHYNKPNVSRKSRIGIFDFYAALLMRLGASFVETNFAVIVSHLMTEIVSSPRNASGRYETLLIRTLVGILLRDLIGVRMLSEQAQIGAIQELANAYLKRWPAMMPGQVSPDSAVLVIVLREVAGLLQQLGNAPPPVQVCSVLILSGQLPYVVVGRTSRAAGNPPCSSQPYDPNNRSVGPTMLLLFDPSAVTQIDTCGHGNAPARSDFPFVTCRPLRHQPPGLGSRLWFGCPCLDHSRTPALRLL